MSAGNPSQSPEPSELVIRLTVSRGRHLEGTVKAEGAGEAGFSGWVELMAVIDRIRSPGKPRR